MLHSALQVLQPAIHNKMPARAPVLVLVVFVMYGLFVSVHKHAKKITRPISSHLDRGSIKDLLYWIKHQIMICVLAGQSPYPKRARKLHHVRSGSQSQREIRFIFPAHGAGHLINRFIVAGNYGNKLDQSVPPSSSTTPPTNAVYDGCYYYYLPWGDTKPCVCVDSHWEDISFRLDNLNILTRLCERLVSK